ncbi:unnamed protein product [Clonostachys byssicola]|uniref:Transcription factor domain-containing protein n=1 Tax=Clonostachys byssicola TaxID=160290 RepID=A0A9N9Y255_9HYPO|nr:unnamed protein product [Clonostachys byssicola]
MAEGDRAIEGMQAFYLLVCWKDPDDDISYLHTGYASRILHDLDLEQWDGDDRQALRRRRTWLALYRQDKQQNLFFMRKTSGGFADEESVSRIGDISTWIQSPHSTLLDLIACCSADLRRIQSRLRTMVQKASPTMLPCLVEVMVIDLLKWKSAWRNHFEDKRKAPSIDNLTAIPNTMDPGMEHLNTLLGLWEHGVRLHVSSAILRQALTVSVSASLRSRGEYLGSSLDKYPPDIAEFLSADTPGLSGSVVGALETLRHLLAFPEHHLRHAPDALVLLAPNAALFLCQLLSLPGTGILGSHFQKTAICLIEGITNHLKNAIQSPQDTLTLHSAYLDSLLKLIHPGPSLCMDPVEQSTPVITPSHDLIDERLSHYHEPATHAADVGVSGMPESTNTELCLSQELDLDLHMHGLANLVDIDYFWEIPPVAIDTSIGDEGRSR